uniref:Uncharacterized protein n=1 Tax=Arundo donax TaxID=35708 RepID=A0A0A9F6L8_ARUDO
MPIVDSFMEITLPLLHVTPSHGESPQGSSDCPHVGGAFCHWSISARRTVVSWLSVMPWHARTHAESTTATARAAAPLIILPLHPSAASMRGSRPSSRRQVRF